MQWAPLCDVERRAAAIWDTLAVVVVQNRTLAAALHCFWTAGVRNGACGFSHAGTPAKDAQGKGNDGFGAPQVWSGGAKSVLRCYRRWCTHVPLKMLAYSFCHQSANRSWEYLVTAVRDFAPHVWE